MVSDIMMANVLRSIRKTDLMDPYPRMKAYFERCHARPAWKSVLGLYAERDHRGHQIDLRNEISPARSFQARSGVIWRRP
jgi:hypothetical protein